MASAAYSILNTEEGFIQIGTNKQIISWQIMKELHDKIKAFKLWGEKRSEFASKC